MTIATCEFESPPLHMIAQIAKMVQHNLAKVGVASSSLVFRSLISMEIDYNLHGNFCYIEI